MLPLPRHPHHANLTMLPPPPRHPHHANLTMLLPPRHPHHANFPTTPPPPRQLSHHATTTTSSTGTTTDRRLVPEGQSPPIKHHVINGLASSPSNVQSSRPLSVKVLVVLVD
ncbi:hypothetical protein Pmani_037868 [Petrolisthes manimaculis]|uniref:Uncharacterized protein n=1 Tax=Petrolisthes manimaculis TaxID=1843537 RepID=A0AAE1NHB2_9EUCA|nr:hypothetical protein Pmani_037868 [Petrolisthes manimaculis]